MAPSPKPEMPVLSPLLINPAVNKPFIMGLPPLISQSGFSPFESEANEINYDV